MITVRLKYVVEQRDRHGNWRLYLRHRNNWIRLRHKPGTPEFLGEYEAARAMLAQHTTAASPANAAPRPRAGMPAAPGSLAWLCQRYYGSAEFKTLGTTTQRVRRAILERVCQGDDGRDGQKPYRSLQPQHVARRRDAHVEKPEAANAIVKAMRQVFAWALLPHVNLADRNPARDVPYLKGNPDGFHAWTLDELRRYEACHPLGSKARLALALLLFTGVRRGDVVHLGRQMARDGQLHFTERKGVARKPKHRVIPILPPLQEAIDAGPAGHLNFITTDLNGAPFTAAGFGNRFRKWCDEASLPDCSAHGLRKLGATILAEAGASEHQLMAIYGWESPKQAAIYTRKANRQMLAAQGLPLLATGLKWQRKV